MAIELVTGHSGAAHVSGADAGAMHAGICGSDSYVLGAVPSVTMSDANTLVIQPCDLMVEGRHVRLSGTNTLSIRSGAQTGKRNDLVYVRYSYDASTGTESAKLGVKEGTTATTATDPALDNPSSVLDGATIADVAIVRVSLDALTPTATWLLPQLPSLEALGERLAEFPFHGYKDDIQTENSSDMWVPVLKGSVSDGSATVQHRVFPASLGNIKGIWMGTKTVTSAGAATPFMSPTDFKSITGSSYDINSFAIFGMNGDWRQLNGAINLAFNPQNNYINMYCTPSTTNKVRVQYLILHW